MLLCAPSCWTRRPATTAPARTTAGCATPSSTSPPRCARSTGGFQPGNQLGWEIGRTGQTPLTPPSVFGHYAQLFRLPQTTLAAPEFQIYTPTEATLRGNFLWGLLTQPGANLRVNLQPFTAAAGDTTVLINAVDQALLWGRMSPAMRQSLANAINAQPDATQRVQTALYLTLLSGQHAIQH